MAKYVPSALIGRISRSAGSTTFAHNRFGAYLRNRVIPTNPVTAAQTLVRGSLAAQSAGYRLLTAAQRSAWTALGSSMSRTDTLGSTYTLTGFQAYCSVNRNLFTVSGAAVTDPPVFAMPPALVSITPTATA